MGRGKAGSAGRRLAPEDGADSGIPVGGTPCHRTFSDPVFYAEVAGQTGWVRESRFGEYGFPYSERHICAVWFDPAFRPPRLHAHSGEEVLVEDPGRWNLEAGPDFLDAVLVIGPGKRRVRGDVEIHVRPGGWKSHHHRGDPRYARLIAHVSFFAGVVPADYLPPGTAQISLKDDLALNPFFSFECLDVTSYPYATRATQTPCHAVLAAQSQQEVVALLESAGMARLRVKSERLAASVRERGIEQTLYEEVLCALGYKNNRLPFRRLSRTVELAALRDEAAGNTTHAYALLLGVAGLLPDKIAPNWDAETRAFVRSLWDIWWKKRTRWDAVAMSRQAWSLTGLRPPNHPIRRLMAAACLFSRPQNLGDWIVAQPIEHPDAWLQQMTAAFQRAGPAGYWSRRGSLSGKRQAEETALIGDGRMAAILSNVVMPLLAACGRTGPGLDGLLHALPPEETNSIIAQTSFVLLGRDQSPAIYRTGLRQQGLMQIFHDFCLNDRSACAQCPLAAALMQARDTAHSA